MKKAVIPEKYTETILSIAKRDSLLECYDLGENLAEIEQEELNSYKCNKKFEQLFYQFILLYDEVILTDYRFDLYDISKLCSSKNITYLDNVNQELIIDALRINHIAPRIEYDFSQYIKPAVIHIIKKELAPFYSVKYKGFSDYQFASNYFDMIYMSKEQSQPLVKKYSHIYDTNAIAYNMRSILHDREPIKMEYYNILLAGMASAIDPLLRNFELAKYEEVDIMDPPYRVERLGVTSKNIKDISEIYGTLKIECSRMIPMLPSFTSIWEVLDYKEKNRRQLRNLSNEINRLETILKTEGKEKMIIKASNDVEKAAKELSNSNNTKVDKWVTFISLPATLLEYYNSLPPIASVPLAVCGISSYLKKKYIEDKHGWVNVIR